MTNRTKKHIRPISLAAVLAVVGVMAAFIVLNAAPGAAQAQESICAEASGATLQVLIDAGICQPAGAENELPQLATPANLTVDGSEVTSLDISWDSVTDASEYRIEYMGPMHNAYQVHGTVTATSARIVGLEPNTRYSIRVTALGVADTSLNSDPAMDAGNTAPVAYDLMVNGQPMVALNSPGTHKVEAEVATDSPSETTTVSVRIDESDDTMYLDQDPGITYSQSGLRGVGERSDDVGNLVIDVRDAATRVFTLTVTCTASDVASLRGVLDIEIRDDRQVLVASATVECAPLEAVQPPTERSSACYAISGMPDRIGDDPDTTGVVEYSDVELYTTDKSVQLTVTSYEKAYTITTQNNVETITETDCPHWPQTSVFIRLVDTPGVLPGMPEVDDEGGFVDTNGFIDEHGEVVGVSSGGELMLDIEATRGIMLNEAQTRQVGVREGTFRVFTPADAEIGDQYYVELYDSRDTERIKHLHRDPFRARFYDRTLKWVGYYDGLTTVSQEYERVVYVSPPVLGVNELQVTFDTGETATANLRWEEIAGAVEYTVAVIDTSNPNMYTLHGAAMKAANVARHHEFTGLVNGRKYIFAVYAKLSNGTYSQLRVFIATPEFVASPSS